MTETGAHLAGAALGGRAHVCALFGNRADWADAAMLQKLPQAVFERVGRELRAAVAAFVQRGIPQPRDAQPWTAASDAASHRAVFTEDGVRLHAGESDAIG